MFKKIRFQILLIVVVFSRDWDILDSVAHLVIKLIYNVVKSNQMNLKFRYVRMYIKNFVAIFQGEYRQEDIVELLLVTVI